jgi:purine-binding chemotaxis protein CheW
MNLRGQVISIIDLRKKLSITPKSDNSEEAVIIIDVDGIQVGAIVDSINKVLSVEGQDVSDVPEISHQINAKYIQGIHRGENALTVLLKISHVLDFNDMKIVKGPAPAKAA